MRIWASRMLVGLLLLIGAVWPAGAPVGAQEATPAAGCPAAAPEANLAVLRRFFEDAIGGGDLAILDEVVAPDVIYHGAVVPDVSGLEGVKRIYGELLTGFPGVEFTLLSSTADDESVVVRYQIAGVHSGDFRGMAPTGEARSWTQAAFADIRCGQIVEMWAEVSQLDRLRQLGVLAAEGPAARMAGGGAPVVGPGETPAPVEAATPCAAAKPDELRAVVERLRAEVYGAGDFQIMPEIFTDSYRHGSANGPDAIGIEEGARRIGTFVTAFPDLEWTFDDVIVEGDRVSARWTTRGTHDGDLAGFAATGKPVAFTGISTFFFQCGKMVEFQTEMDAAGMLEQIGAPVRSDAG